MGNQLGRFSWANTKFDIEIGNMCSDVIGEFKNFELLSGGNQGVTRSKSYQRSGKEPYLIITTLSRWSGLQKKKINQPSTALFRMPWFVLLPNSYGKKKKKNRQLKSEAKSKLNRNKLFTTKKLHLHWVHWHWKMFIFRTKSLFWATFPDFTGIIFIQDWSIFTKSGMFITDICGEFNWVVHSASILFGLKSGELKLQKAILLLQDTISGS